MLLVSCFRRVFCQQQFIAKFSSFNPRHHPTFSKTPKIPGFVTTEQWIGQTQDESLGAPIEPDSAVKTDEIYPNVKISTKNINMDEIVAYKTFNQVSELDARVRRALLSQGHATLTPIQQYTFSLMFSGRQDLLASAETGSGKTIAFLAPLISRLLSAYPEQAMDQLRSTRGRPQLPLLLVLAPTRELALQIQQTAISLCRFAPFLRSEALIGGQSKFIQLSRMFGGGGSGGYGAMAGGGGAGCHVAVATPGRLLDLMQEGAIHLSQCTHLVLDEADKMLDMGFEPQIREVIERTEWGLPGAQRLTAMFSATFPREVRQLAGGLLRSHAAQLSVGETAGAETPIVPRSIRHSFVRIEDGPDNSSSTVRNHLIRMLRDDAVTDSGNEASVSGRVGGKRTLVFCQMKREVDALAGVLFRSGVECAAIHGDKSQNQREFALRQFKQGRVDVLVATSVAARGLDLPSVDRVVMTALPGDLEEYVHRAGRTGRMGAAGEVVTFVEEETLRAGNGRAARDLLKLLSSGDQSDSDSVENKREVPQFIREAAEMGAASKKRKFATRTTDADDYGNDNESQSVDPRRRRAWGGEPTSFRRFSKPHFSSQFYQQKPAWNNNKNTNNNSYGDRSNSGFRRNSDFLEDLRKDAATHREKMPAYSQRFRTET